MATTIKRSVMAAWAEGDVGGVSDGDGDDAGDVAVVLGLEL
jgi:hypothetical protein